MKLLPPAPAPMYALRGQTVHEYFCDNWTNTRYTFNSLGYRSDREFDTNESPIVVLGNTLTFGLGLDIAQTYPEIISQKTGIPVYSFAYGRYAHENSDQLALLKGILALMKPKLVIFQINDLNKQWIDGKISSANPKEVVVEKYYKFKTELDIVLADIPNILLHWDYNDYGIDFSQCLIYNKYHIDSIDFTLGPMMGKTSHKIVAEKIIREINEQRI